MLLWVSVFCGSNSTSRRYNSYTILDLRLQMGSRICHPLHLARGNKPGARDDMEPPSVPYEHRAHIFPWSRNACLQVGYNRFIFSILLGTNLEFLVISGLGLAVGEFTLSSSTRCFTCLPSPALLWASSLSGITRVSEQIQFRISTASTPGWDLALWGCSHFR